MSRARLVLVLPAALVAFAVPPGAVSAGQAPPSADDAQTARTLSISRARQAAYRVAQRVGAAEGAVYAVAGYCRRASSSKVSCWAGIVWSDQSGAAQKVVVTLRGSRLSARRTGRVYTGSVGEKESSQSGGEWAICGIRSSVCIGS